MTKRNEIAPHIVLKQQTGTSTVVRKGSVKTVLRSVTLGVITAGAQGHVLSGSFTKGVVPGAQLIGFVEGDLNLAMVGPKGLPLVDPKRGFARIGWLYNLGNGMVKVSVDKNANLVPNRYGDVEFKLVGSKKATEQAAQQDGAEQVAEQAGEQVAEQAGEQVSEETRTEQEQTEAEAVVAAAAENGNAARPRRRGRKNAGETAAARAEAVSTEDTSQG